MTISHPEELLAFYVNGTLNEPEMTQVIEHLVTCQQCQHEIMLLQSMKEVSKKMDPTFPGKLSWHMIKHNLSAKIMKKQLQKKCLQPMFATAAVLLILIQTGLIINLSHDDKTYTQVGGNTEGIILQIKLKPAATVTELNKTLLEASAEIISGPSANGIYRIRVSENANKNTTIKNTQRLESRKDLFNYVNKN